MEKHNIRDSLVGISCTMASVQLLQPLVDDQNNHANQQHNSSGHVGELQQLPRKVPQPPIPKVIVISNSENNYLDTKL